MVGEIRTEDKPCVTFYTEQTNQVKIFNSNFVGKYDMIVSNATLGTNFYYGGFAYLCTRLEKDGIEIPDGLREVLLKLKG